MAAIHPSSSTTVRSGVRKRAVGLAWLRLRFALGIRLSPRATLDAATRLFTTPLPSGRRRALATASDGAHESTITVDGLQLRTYAWGDPAGRPYVLFAHGWSSHGTRILPWVAPLRAAGYAVVAFDQAAHGRSDGDRTTLPDFACHLLAVGRRFGPAAAVIGHSLGAAATMLALAAGLQARRALLLAPPADPLAAAERFARAVGLRARDGRRMFAGFEREMRFDARDLQVQNAAPAIARPALVVHDLEDPEVPWAEGERYARYWPDARLLTTRGLGHNRIVGDPAVIDAGLRFLGGEAVGDRVVSTAALPFGIG